MSMKGFFEDIEGGFEAVKGHLEKDWGKLTHDEIMETKGDYDKLVGKYMKKYNCSKDAAERDLRGWKAAHKAKHRKAS